MPLPEPVPTYLVGVTEQQRSYGRMLQQLLPRGAVWRFESGSVLHRLLLAIAGELSRVEERGAALVEESDPRTAVETLGEWERLLGLPDTCVQSIPATVEERRLAITQKLVKVGGQSRAYFIALAAACGYTVTIDDSYGATTFRTGRARVNSRLYSDEWAHVWRMDVQPPTGPALAHAELECIISRVAPAHTVVLFEYL